MPTTSIYSATLDGVNDVIKLNGGTESWDSGFMGYLSNFDSIPDDILDATITLAGTGWTLAALRFGADFENITRITDNTTGGARIDMLKLGTSSVVTLDQARVRFIYGDEGTHDITLGSQTVNALLLNGSSNTVTTGSGYVGLIETGDTDTIQVNGDVGLIKTHQGNDTVTVLSGHVSSLELGSGSDSLIVRNNAGLGSVQDDGGQFELRNSAYIDSLRSWGATNTIDTYNTSSVRYFAGGNGVVDITMNGNSRIRNTDLGDATGTFETGNQWVDSLTAWRSALDITIGDGGIGYIQLATDTVGNHHNITATGHIGSLNVFDQQSTTLTLGAGGLGTGRLGRLGDTVNGGSGFIDYLHTGWGDDTVNMGTGNADSVWTGRGMDTVNIGAAWIDYLNTGQDNDTVTIGTGGANVIRTGSGNDTVTTGAQWIELISTQDGEDHVTIMGGAGMVRLGDDDDTIVVGEFAGSSVSINGGNGSDTLDFSLYGVGVTFTLDSIGIWQNPGAPGGDIDLPGTGYIQETSIENLVGSAHADLLTGDGQANVLSGGDGFDTIYGGQHHDTIEGGRGNDFIKAGTGNDFIDGGRGRDKLFGGKGEDVFHFAAFANNDRVYDFVDGEDMISIADHVGGFGTLTIADSGSDLVITHDGGQIKLLGLAGTVLTLDDFMFV